jgi:SAM-dependent methyltransferase
LRGFISIGCNPDFLHQQLLCLNYYGSHDLLLILLLMVMFCEFCCWDGNCMGDNCLHSYDQEYYCARNQQGDRPALWFYARLCHRYFRPGRLLDFGCGAGHLMKRLSHWYAVDGCDSSPAARMMTSSLLPGTKLYATLQDLPENSYSGIVALHVFEHVCMQEMADFLARLRVCLVSRGRILFVVPELFSRGHRLKGEHWFGFGDSSHCTLQDAEYWATTIRNAGFREVDKGTDGLWNFPYRRGRSRLFDSVTLGWGTAVQLISGRLILPPGTGESLIMVVEKL